MISACDLTGPESTACAMAVTARKTSHGPTVAASTVQTIHMGTNIGLLLSLRSLDMDVRALLVADRGHPGVIAGHALLNDKPAPSVAADVRDVGPGMAGAPSGEHRNQHGESLHALKHPSLTFGAKLNAHARVNQTPPEAR